MGNSTEDPDCGRDGGPVEDPVAGAGVVVPVVVRQQPEVQHDQQPAHQSQQVGGHPEWHQLQKGIKKIIIKIKKINK